MAENNGQNFFAYVDSLQDVTSAKSIESGMNYYSLVNLFWDSFMKYFSAESELEKQKARLKCIYVNRYFNSSIPMNANIGRFNTPHGFYGIFISEDAKIGAGCTIFQHVTIGSNTLLDSKSAGTPTIGNSVYIGAGAKIIGNVTVGNNVRIGAGCTVTRDIPDNCTAVQSAPAIIQKNTPQDNRWVSIGDFRKIKSGEIFPAKSSPSRAENFPPIIPVFADQNKNLYRTLDSTAQAAHENAFKILFCGDLILLEDQVKRGLTVGGGYDFDEMFEFTKEYISTADLSIGVFEGPLGGNSVPYSQSNYGDGKRLYLNFPDEFADAVKKAGFDLVTTANNHMLDMGLDGLNRTIDVLRRKNLPFVGTYKSVQDKATSRIKLVEKSGMKIAVLAYTAFVNNVSLEQLMSRELFHTTSLIAPPNHPACEILLRGVKEDFALAKSCKPDLIIVLPHWGEQFKDEPNDFQKFWRNVFISLGADIVLGDHTHSVQPAKIETVDGRKTFTLYCPGNYANVYREYDGDASLLAEVYVDRTTKKILGGAIIPMWTRSTLAGNYRPLPVRKILTDDKLRNQISTFELERISYVLRHITRVALGTELDENLIQERYFFDEHGFQRQRVAPIQIDERLAKSKFLACLREAQNVCFVGDSITHGTKNGGVPWFEPIASFVNGKIFNCSLGGATIKFMASENILSGIATIPADLFVAAIGTNDVRYRNPDVCSMTPEEYIADVQKFRDAVREKNSAAKFIFIAPWTSTDGDKVSALPFREKTLLNAAYSAALKNWCVAQGEIFINANPYIDAYLKIFPHKNFLVDFIHPNATSGVELYSAAVLAASAD